MFHDTLTASCLRSNTCLCVGLDLDWVKISNWFPESSFKFMEFTRRLIEATYKHTSVYKINHAFFAGQGLEEELARIIRYIKESCPQIPVILDAKRGDIGNTAQHYAEEAFLRYRADAVTVNPFMGWDTIEPFLRYSDKGVILLCRTSNQGSAWIQEEGNAQPVYLKIAQRVHLEENPNLLLVVGATQLDPLSKVRQTAPLTTLLVPGIGAQGGEIAGVLDRVQRRDGLGVIINCSRGIIVHQEVKDYFNRVEETVARYARSMPIR